MSRQLADIKKQYDEQGYVVVQNLIAASEFAPLQDACARVVKKTRQAHWMHRRTVGKQFPPFDVKKDVDIWGIQHVMHPELGEGAFLKWYTSDNLVQVAAELLGCEEDHLQMGKINRSGKPASLTDGASELFNLLINPQRDNFALRWHRDDVPENATEEQEREALTRWHHGVRNQASRSGPEPS